MFGKRKTPDAPKYVVEVATHTYNAARILAEAREVALNGDWEKAISIVTGDECDSVLSGCAQSYALIVRTKSGTVLHFLIPDRMAAAGAVSRAKDALWAVRDSDNLERDLKAKLREIGLTPLIIAGEAD